MKTLVFGDAPNLAIVELQARLRSAGYYPSTGLIDGVFHVQLNDAVKKFQETAKLKVDGIVGEITWNALTKLTEDNILFLFIHCSASPAGLDLSGQWIYDYHTKSKGWSRPGYSDVIRLNGQIDNIYPWNGDYKIETWEYTFGTLKLSRCSRHVCYIGGVDADDKNKAEDTRTEAQIRTLNAYVDFHVAKYPNIIVVGHNQVQNKACPSFDVVHYFKSKGVPAKNLAMWGKLWE